MIDDFAETVIGKTDKMITPDGELCLCPLNDAREEIEDTCDFLDDQISDAPTDIENILVDIRNFLSRRLYKL